MTPATLSLHSTDRVLSLRHLPTWILLTFAAGAVNAVGFLACARFVSHVTGMVSNIGMDAGSVEIALDYALVLGSFVGGAMVSAAFVEGPHHLGRRPFYAGPLIASAIILVSVGVAGTAGAFGSFGTSCETPRDLAFVSILAFAMGLQNAAVATSTGMVVRTTHMTGSATDLGVHLTTAFYAEGPAREKSIRHAALRAGKIAGFGAGAAAGVGLARQFYYGALFVPATVVVVATLLSFMRPVPDRRVGALRAKIARKWAILSSRWPHHEHAAREDRRRSS